jgi:chemotaxis signal transduction protein
VRAGTERYGVALAAVDEVVDLAAPAPVPGRLEAFRGVTRWRDRHVSVVHLGALLQGGAPPAAPGDTAVVVRVADRPVAFEVEAVEEVVEGSGTTTLDQLAAVAVGEGVWRVGGVLVTMLDLEGLAERLAERRDGE